MGDHRFHKQEKNMEAKLDKFAQDMAQKRGYNEVPWEKLMRAVLLIYLCLTVLAMFYRPDFLSMTCISIGIYGVQLPHNMTRRTFRMLVVFLFLSFIYDLVFLVFIHNSEADDELDSHMADNVRRFAYFFAWISFAFRPVVIAVFWKASLDFRRIVRHKGHGAEPQASGANNSGMAAEDLEIARIMNMYGANKF